MELREQLEVSLGNAYRLGQELGGGGMSRLFVAEDLKLGRAVVVKVLAPELSAGISAERFAREIKVAASLQQANIVPVLTVGETSGLPYFTMPFVDGKSLRARLSTQPQVTIAECLGILRDVARALGYAHEHGVVHRDIKPDNVLLSRGTAEVTDFGIAKAIEASRVPNEPGTLTGMGTSLGTPAYMSPEQIAGDPNLDHRADIYSLGVMAYEMLEGRVPFTGTPQAIVAAQINSRPPPLTAHADLPPALRRAVMKCLEKAPVARYATADAFLSDIEAVATPSGAMVSVSRPSGGRVLALAAGIGVIAAVAWFGTGGIRAKRWALSVGVPEVKRLTEIGQYDSAWYIAERVRRILPDDSTRTALWVTGSVKGVLHSIPEGASVYRATFGDTSHWTLVGTTPTDTLWLPIGYGHLRVERAGYRTQRGLLSWWNRTFVLDSINAPNAEMAHIPGGTFGAFLVGLDNLPPITLGDYFLDLHEVTNHEYQAFVDAGGYTKRDWWPSQIADGPKRLSWEDAMSRFIDKTGRPGPATWEAGSFPAGQADLPVSGVSWYEAAAYARFAGKSLPTIFHWAGAAHIEAARYVVTGSNFESTAPRRGSTWSGMSVTGVFDMAGNVREWCENDAGGGQRYILGGGYSESPYGFTDGYAQPAMDRSAINGIRLAKYQRSDTGVPIARRPQPRAFRDYTKEHPVSDDAVGGYLDEFDYDHTALNAKLVSRDTTPEDWIEERVAIDAAYGKERMEVVLLLPRHHSRTIQPVVYFPGSGAIFVQSSRGPRFQIGPRFIAKSGRAVVMPILKSTYERRDSLRSDIPDGSIFWRDHVVMWVKDIRRTLDYLATRPDMDTTKFAYFGYSWGAYLAPVNLAADSRFKAAVLRVGGLLMGRARPEVDPFNYLPRVKIPVLMLNGRYDSIFPVDIAQRPFFNSLGTPKASKDWKIYPDGHDVPRTELMAETLKWLDKYLGQPR